jgi:hypothetical protein
LRATVARVPAPEVETHSVLPGGVARSHLDVTLRFSPSFGSSPVNLVLANSKAATAALAGPSHNSAVKGSIRNRHRSGLFGPFGMPGMSAVDCSYCVYGMRPTVAQLARARAQAAIVSKWVGRLINPVTFGHDRYPVDVDLIFG